MKFELKTTAFITGAIPDPNLCRACKNRHNMCKYMSIFIDNKFTENWALCPDCFNNIDKIEVAYVMEHL